MTPFFFFLNQVNNFIYQQGQNQPHTRGIPKSEEPMERGGYLQKTPILFKTSSYMGPQKLNKGLETLTQTHFCPFKCSPVSLSK